MYEFALAYANKKIIPFSAAASKLVSEKRMTFADSKTIDFTRPQVRKNELQKGVLRMCSYAVNELSARSFVSQSVGIENDKLDEMGSIFKYRMPELRSLGLLGVLERLSERLRAATKIELREAFDTVMKQDIAKIRNMLAIDAVMFVYNNKFTNFLLSVVDEICNPRTNISVLIDSGTSSDNRRHIHGNLPLSQIYLKHRICLVNLDQNGKVGIPVDSAGVPTKHSGGSCVVCSLRTRKDVTHVSKCTRKDDPDHVVGCPICMNDPGHGLLTCPWICRATSRSFEKKDSIENYKVHFEQHPMKSKFVPKGRKDDKKPKGKKGQKNT